MAGGMGVSPVLPGQKNARARRPCHLSLQLRLFSPVPTSVPSVTPPPGHQINKSLCDANPQSTLKKRSLSRRS